MKFGKLFCQAVGLVALGALASTAALGQVTARFVVPGGVATTSKVVPGGNFSFEYRLDAPATSTIGSAFRLIQTAPATPPVAFTITARDFTGSIYNDTASGTPDVGSLNPVTLICGAVVAGQSACGVLVMPSPLLNPDNDDNLGRNTIGLAGAAPGTNLFVEAITFSVDPATPLGSYTIQPTAGGTSAVTDTSFNDYDIQASGAQFVVVVGQTLTAVIAGGGTGTVTSDVGAINCPGTCSDIYPGTTVTLTATPTGLSTFTGWSGGGCSGTGTCVVAVTAATTVTATFAPVVPVNLTVTKSGTGTGTVTSAPVGINCGATCTAPFAPATVVTLTAAAGGGSAFIGWSGGGCSGTGTCVVTMAAATTVNAQFDLVPQTLTVTLAGSGTGTVTSAPAGITCPGTCAAPFAGGSTVTLTAAPAVGSTFGGWSGGGCSGTGTCVVTMSAAQTVTATFNLPQFLVTVVEAGNGTGVVTSAPAGITCPGTCSANFTSGTSITLTAVPNAGQNFTGWSGAGCSGTGTCVFTVTAATSVTATFTDTTPPIATITGFPTNPSSVPNPQFTFTSNEAGSTFTCQLDGGAVFACTSPTTVSVGNGAHTFTVIAIDPGGNPSAPASYSWTAAGIVVNNPIPTLNEWMLMLLALMLGAAGMVMARRRA